MTVAAFTKYPANPPAASNLDTLDSRTLQFFAMVAISIVALVAATRIRRRLLERLGAWDANVVAAFSFIGLIAAAQLLLPAISELPPGFPADVLYRFRLASIAVGATTWTVIGLGVLAERLVAPVSPRHAPVAITI